MPKENDYEAAWADQVPADAGDAASAKRVKDLESAASKVAEKSASEFEAAYREANAGENK